MTRRELAPLFLLLLTAVVACGPPAPRGGDGTQPPPGASSRSSGAARTLVYATRTEPGTIAPRIIGQAGSTLVGIQVIFNALVAYVDETATARPHIVESLPSLNSDSWRVFPDGRMETTYRLKPGLRWHDGTPASAGDFRFSWQVYTKPEYGISGAPPFHAIDEVVAVDERTVLIRWNRLYADAASLAESHDEFPIVPAHILREPFETLDVDAFVNLPFWNREFIGLGPYRLDRWEAGSFLEGVAFDSYTLGRPKIERVRIVFIEDYNTTLANLLSNQVHVATDNSIALAQIDVIKREASDRLSLLADSGGAWRATVFQLRPEYVSPQSLLDHRVRAALAHAFDKDTLNDGVYFGLYGPADFMVNSQSMFGPAIDRGTIKYPFDPRRSEQLMNEAGLFRSADGFYASDLDGRFTADFKSTASGADVTALAAMASTWRQLGFNVQESIVPVAEARNAELGNTFPGMFTRTSNSSIAAIPGFTTARIPRPENRWIGPNRGGWSSADFDRVAEPFTTTLDTQARADQVTQMARTFTAELPVISQFFLNRPIPYPVELRGPKQGLPVEANWNYNIHEWEFS
ncbi:MAG: hypothetical protein HW416_1750 [Chloroflexi bacterium]|nr:hypothetical protein [Chloroflexota bacterium]